MASSHSYIADALSKMKRGLHGRVFDGFPIETFISKSYMKTLFNSLNKAVCDEELKTWFDHVTEVAEKGLLENGYVKDEVFKRFSWHKSSIQTIEQTAAIISSCVHRVVATCQTLWDVALEKEIASRRKAEWENTAGLPELEERGLVFTQKDKDRITEGYVAPAIEKLRMSFLEKAERVYAFYNKKYAVQQMLDLKFRILFARQSVPNASFAGVDVGGELRFVLAGESEPERKEAPVYGTFSAPPPPMDAYLDEGTDQIVFARKV